MVSFRILRVQKGKKSVIVKTAIVLLCVILAAKAYGYCSREPELNDNAFFDLLESEYFQKLSYKVVEVECSDPKVNTSCLYIIDKIGYRPDGTWFVGRFLTPAPSLNKGFLSVSSLKPPVFKSKSSIYTRDWQVDVGTMDPITPNGVEISALFSTGHFEPRRNISGQIHFIGVATGGLMSYIAHYFKNMNLVGVDIDANSEYLAKKWFGYRNNRNSRVIIGNGAEFIKNMALNGEQTDAVLVDACHNQPPADGIYCPVEAIRTPEFLENLSRVIGARGITAFNVYDMKGTEKRYGDLKSSFSKHFAYCTLFDKVRMVSNVFMVCANYDFEKRKAQVDRKKVLNFLDEIRLHQFLQLLV